MLQVFSGKSIPVAGQQLDVSLELYTGRVAEITARNFGEIRVREPAMLYHRMVVHTCPLSYFPTSCTLE